MCARTEARLRIAEGDKTSSHPSASSPLRRHPERCKENCQSAPWARCGFLTVEAKIRTIPPHDQREEAAPWGGGERPRARGGDRGPGREALCRDRARTEA